MAEREDLRLKKQAEEMQNARQAQLENARMQRELQAAARELAKHQEEAAKAREAMLAARARVKATTQSAGQSIAGQQKSPLQGGPPQMNEAGQHPAGGRNMAGQDVLTGAVPQNELSQEEYWAGGRKAAEQRAAQQRAIQQAAERRALKKQAAEEAAALLARQRAQEAKKHHTSPETKQLQNLLLEQITAIMEEEQEEQPAPRNFAAVSSEQKTVEEPQIASGEEDFGDLVFLDENGEETKPEPISLMQTVIKDMDIEAEEYGQENTAIGKWGNFGQWFQTICWMHIPVIGFWYLVIMAIRRKTPKEKKAFARAYILFRLLVLILAATILYIFYRMGVSFLEQILSYINAHL